MPQPPIWEQGIFLGDTQVKGLLESQFPKLQIDSLKFLKDGFDSCAYEVNGNLIFRLPKRAEVAKQLLAEIAFLPRIRSKSRIAIPDFRFMGIPTDNYPYHFVGYAKLVGTDQTNARVCLPHEEIERLAKFLQALHQTDISDLPNFPKDKNGANPECLSKLDLLAEESDLLKLGKEFARSLDWDLLSQDFPMRVVHNDLLPEHILMQGEQIAAIIDWGDIALGDPAADYAGVGYSFGMEVMDACLHVNRLNRDKRLRSKAHLTLVMAALNDLEYGSYKRDQARIDFALDALRKALKDHPSN